MFEMETEIFKKRTVYLVVSITLLGAAILFIILLVRISENDETECKRSLTTTSGSHAPKEPLCSGQLIFYDNFEKLDLSKWQHESTLSGGQNWEFQWYANNRSVSYIEDNVLHIKPNFVSEEFGNDFLYSGTIDLESGTLFDTCTNARDFGCSRTGTSENLLNPIKSARIRTVYSFAYKYGKLEIRAKLPTGDWLWPALWLMPKYNQYGLWPASGEIDLMEGRGNSELFSAEGVNIGNQLIASTLHFGPNWSNDKWNSATFQKSDHKGFNSSFHRYQFEWTDSYLKFLVDDQEIGTVTPPEGGFWELGNLNDSNLENPWKNQGKMAPFNDEFYIIINLAVGGTNGYFPDNAKNSLGPKPWNNTSPRTNKDFWEGRSYWVPTWNRSSSQSHLQVDYVKVWAL